MPTARAPLHLPFASSQRFTSSQSPAGPSAIAVICVLEQLVFFFLSSYLQPVVRSCRHVIGSHAPIIGWAETAQLKEHDITFTSLSTLKCSILASKPGLVLVVFVHLTLSSEPSDVSSPLNQDLVEFTQYGGSFFEVTWCLSTGLQCASEFANLYLDVLDSHVWQSSGGSQVSLPVH